MKNHIRRLRIIALLLFIIPSLALLGSLILHNYLIGFKYFHQEQINFKETKPGEKFRYLCSEENEYCSSIKYERINSLGDCRKYEMFKYYTDENGSILSKINENLNVQDIKNSPNKKIFLNYELNDNIDPTCILNTNSKYLYNILPTYYETISKLLSSKKTILGTAGTLILVDTSLIHRGSPLLSGKRYALTNYYVPEDLYENLKKQFVPKFSFS